MTQERPASMSRNSTARNSAGQVAAERPHGRAMEFRDIEGLRHGGQFRAWEFVRRDIRSGDEAPRPHPRPTAWTYRDGEVISGSRFDQRPRNVLVVRRNPRGQADVIDAVLIGAEDPGFAAGRRHRADICTARSTSVRSRADRQADLGGRSKKSCATTCRSAALGTFIGYSRSAVLEVPAVERARLRPRRPHFLEAMLDEPEVVTPRRRRSARPGPLPSNEFGRRSCTKRRHATMNNLHRETAPLGLGADQRAARSSSAGGWSTWAVGLSAGTACAAFKRGGQHSRAPVARWSSCASDRRAIRNTAPTIPTGSRRNRRGARRAEPPVRGDAAMPPRLVSVRRDTRRP